MAGVIADGEGGGEGGHSRTGPRVGSLGALSDEIDHFSETCQQPSNLGTTEVILSICGHDCGIWYT